MFKKLILTLVMSAFCTIAFAESCPSVKDIKNNSLHGWKAYDSDDDTPLAPERFAAYTKSLEQFTLAEWKKSKDRTSIHCFYRDSNGSALEAYLAKDNLSPTLSSNASSKDQWYQVSGSLNCAASPEECRFQTNLGKQPQLATR